jgi:hypothetical protein
MATGILTVVCGSVEDVDKVLDQAPEFLHHGKPTTELNRPGGHSTSATAVDQQFHDRVRAGFSDRLGRLTLK